MGEVAALGLAEKEAVRVFNPGGQGAYVLTCEHASNFVPAGLARLGLAAAELERHIAWDPGALAVARRLSAALDAPLVEACISRLVIDCNRPLHADDLIPAVSESTAIPGNQQLSAEVREARVAQVWKPFHERVDAVLRDRISAGRPSRLVSIHSFTPVYKGKPRPWQVGIIHDEDDRLARPLLRALAGVPGLNVGDNQPYSPTDLVYFTLERHARPRDLPCAMIEIRNDEVADEAAQQRWAELLSALLAQISIEQKS